MALSGSTQNYDSIPWLEDSEEPRLKGNTRLRFSTLRHRQNERTLDSHHNQANPSDVRLLSLDDSRSLEESDRTQLRATGQQTAPWRPGFWRRMPVFAVVTLLSVLLCTAAAVAVLIYSDGRDVETWGTLTPSVIIATLSVISNSLLGIALTEGLVISFWRTVIHGCTLNEAYANWKAGSSFWGAISQGYRSHGAITAIARTMTLVSLVRSPLFQKATTIQANVHHPTQGTLNVQVAQELPFGYAGYHIYSRGGGQGTASLQPNFSVIMNEFSTHTNLVLEESDCSGVCHTVIKGFGYQAQCQKGQTSFTVGNAGTEYTEFETKISLYDTGEDLGYVQDYVYAAGILLEATFDQGNHGPKNETTGKLPTLLATHSCNLTGSIVAYNVTIRDQVVTLSPRSEDQYLQPLILASPGQMSDTVVGGFQYAADYLYSSTAVYRFGGAVSSTILTGALANQMLLNSSSMYNDPMDTMIDGIREISFRAALKAGREENVTVTQAVQQVPYTGYVLRNIFVTEYLYLGIAVAINLIGILAVGMTFWGWWTLGRDFSLNPLETAKAFDSPLFTIAGSNVRFELYPEELRKKRVQYGATWAAGQHSEPKTSPGPGLGNERLVVGEAQDIRTPEMGVKYS